MIPGTTPTHVFTIPLAAAEVAELRITYSQGGKVVFQKEKKDCTVTDKTVTLQLKQEDTLKIDSNVTVRIQMKIKAVSETVLVSRVAERPAEIVLDKAVI